MTVMPEVPANAPEATVSVPAETSVAPVKSLAALSVGAMPFGLQELPERHGQNTGSHAGRKPVGREMENDFGDAARRLLPSCFMKKRPRAFWRDKKRPNTTVWRESRRSASSKAGPPKKTAEI